MKFFQSATTPAAPVDPATAQAQQTAAYQQGRVDARKDVNERGLLQDRDTAVRRAYDRGRRDERAARHPRRRGSPVLTTVLVLAAAAGAFVVYLGVSQGSFSRGGQVVDQNLNSASSTASGAVQNTVNRAGDALENAGQQLKQTAGSNSTNG
jgi:hypothetical protein